MDPPATITGKVSTIIEAHTDGFKTDFAVTVPFEVVHGLIAAIGGDLAAFSRG